MASFTTLKEKLKLKKVYIPLAVTVVLVGYYSYSSYKKAHQPPSYETVTVNQGPLVQTVEATGKLESTDDVALRFEVPGILQTVSVKEGQNVKAGTILATLRLSELNASVAQAYANLQQKIAGATDQDRNFYKAALDSAQASLEQSKIDAATSVTTAQAALDTAQNNLKLAEGGDNNRIVNAAYETGVSTLQTSLAKLDDALTQTQNIVNYTSVIQISDSSKKNSLDAAYLTATQSVASAHLSAGSLTTMSDHANIDLSFQKIELAFNDTIQALSRAGDILNYLPTVTDSSTQTSLDAKKTTIATTRTAITNQYATLIAQRQTIADAKNSYSTYTIAYTKAKRDFEQATANVQTTVQIKESSYIQAKANYESKVQPTRAVDLAPYQAALAQAAASRDKAILRAPMDGVVAKLNKKPGELVTSADIMAQMISPHYEVTVDVPETDIAKIVNSTERETIFTLDAFGEDTKFPGTITSIDKKSTNIQDVVYYQVTIAMATSTIDKPIQAGMTANVTIKTDHRDNVLFVPQRVIRTRDTGEKFVRILNNNQETEATVKLGLKADAGNVEITDGLTKGQVVIVALKKP